MESEEASDRGEKIRQGFQINWMILRDVDTGTIIWQENKDFPSPDEEHEARVTLKILDLLIEFLTRNQTDRVQTGRGLVTIFRELYNILKKWIGNKDKICHNKIGKELSALAFCKNMNSIGFGVLAVEEEEETQRNLRLERRILRDSYNPFDLSERSFKTNFRLSKSAFQYVLDLMEEDLEAPLKCFGLNPIHKLCAVIRFFAEGSSQHGIGKDYDVGIAQSTFSKVLSQCLKIFKNKVCPLWIKLQMTEEEKQKAKMDFHSKHGLPGIIMCIDGTHVEIAKAKEDHFLYYNRKGYYSLNVMVVCDNLMKIRYVDARYPGCNHDSHIYNLSDFRSYFENKYTQGERNIYILGDGGYPLEPWLITPFRLSSPGSRERIFNSKHSGTRNIIERTIGVLKNRFRCLISLLNYSPKKAVDIINSVVALHNICIDYKIDNNMEPNTFPLIVEADNEDEVISNLNTAAVEIRNRILNGLIL